MTELNRLTIAAASAGLAKGEFSARELTQSCVDAMDERCGPRDALRPSRSAFWCLAAFGHERNPGRFEPSLRCLADALRPGTRLRNAST